jgi:hypothetical protein
MRSLGFGLMQQAQVNCDDCNGTGSIYQLNSTLIDEQKERLSILKTNVQLAKDRRQWKKKDKLIFMLIRVGFSRIL